MEAGKALYKYTVNYPGCKLISDVDGDGQRFLDFLHDHITLRLHGARQLQQDVAEQLAVVGHFTNTRLDQIVEIAGNEMAFQHFGNALHFAPELLEHVAAFVIEGDLDEYQQRRAQLMRIHPCVIPRDHLVTLHAFDAFNARRHREPDLLSQVFHRHTTVLLKDLQNAAIDLIEFSY